MITTIQQHIVLEQRELAPEADAGFSCVMSGITLAAKMIEEKIRRAGLSGMVGSCGRSNIQGEIQQKLDIYANDALLHCLGMRDTVAVLVSEENDEPVIFNRGDAKGKYAVFFDPLDGSSNIDANMNVGTIFSIYQIDSDVHEDADRFILQPGICQIAAGYVLYGPSTMLVYTTGHGVFGFTLDPNVGAFVLSHKNLKIPKKGKYYSCNEANVDQFPPSYRRYLEQLKGDSGNGYSARYVGSLVADFHRTLLRGGIFMYPPTDTHPDGKLRLLYEANPLAFIAEQAGGLATNGEQSILRIQPSHIHQRTPLVIGGCYEVENLVGHISQLIES